MNLSSLLSGRAESELLLSPRDCYEANDIELHTGRRITRIDLDRQQIRDDRGGVESYDHLVLATGAYPWVPPISGSDSPGVFVYRTIDDLEAIQRYVGRRTS